MIHLLLATGVGAINLDDVMTNFFILGMMLGGICTGASGRPIQGEVGTIGLETIRIRKKVLKDFRLVVGGDVLAIT